MNVVSKLSSDLGADALKIDTFLWWIHARGEDENEEEEPGAIGVDERELQQYLALHPEKLERGLKLVRAEYVTGVGRIDLLCKDKAGKPVVVELKKHMAGEKALGQLLRYMGWLMHNDRSAREKKVRAILVTHEYNEKLDYAVRAVGDRVQIRYYAVRFEIADTPFDIGG